MSADLRDSGLPENEAWVAPPQALVEGRNAARRRGGGPFTPADVDAAINAAYAAGLAAGEARERAVVVAYLFAEARRHLDVVQPLKDRDNFGAAEASRVSGTKTGTLARAIERGEHRDG